jgi:ADP-heptose:LPS heptosyltransferase
MWQSVRMKRLIDSIDRVRKSFASADGWDPRIHGTPSPLDIGGKRVLVVYLFGGLGDALLLAPALKALAKREPKKPIGLLIPPLGARLFKLIDLPLKLHVLPGELLDPGTDKSARSEAEAKAAAAIAKTKYEVAIDLSFREQLDARRYLADAEIRAGWMRRGETLERAGLTHGTPDSRHETTLHWSRYCALPLERFGVDAPDFSLTWRIKKETRARAEALWGESKKPRVMLVPGGTKERRWHPGRFIAVGRWAAERGASILVVGSPAESQLLRKLCKSIGKGAKPYSGKDLALLIALITASRCVVSNDTGPMHIAFMMGIPTIAVFMQMSPLVWGPPWNSPRFVVLNAQSAKETEPSEQGDVWSRLVIHHLEGMLARRA